MITPQDITDAIVVCAGYDPIYTPKPSEIIISAWEEHFAMHPDINRPEFLQAVTRYWQTPDRRFPQPAAITVIVNEISAERTSEQSDWAQRYRDALSDALAGRDEWEDPTEHARHMSRCLDIIARHKNLTAEEARAWIEGKRGHVQDRFRVIYNGDHMKGWKPDRGAEPGPHREIWTREGKTALAEPWQLSRHQSTTRDERIRDGIDERAQQVIDIQAMRDVYERAYRRAGLLPGSPDEITTTLPVERDSEP